MTSKPQERWRVVLFTDAAVQLRWYVPFLAARGHQLVAVVTSPKRSADPQPTFFGPRTSTPGTTEATTSVSAIGVDVVNYLDVVREAASSIDVLVSNHPQRWAQLLQAWQPDLLISSKFPWRLPAEVLSVPRLGAVNVHPTLLPRFRVTMSPFWILRHGEQQAGVTLHRMAPEFDSGPILSQVAFPLSDDDDISSFGTKLMAAYTPLWEAALPRIAAGDPGEPQDEAAASYFGRIADEEAWRRINWAQPARTVHNIVRSCDWAGQQPPGTLGELGGVLHRITKTRLVAGQPTHAPPGSIVERRGDCLVVQCGAGLLELVAYEPVDYAIGSKSCQG